MAETLQQYFHRVYPQHCQRICEAIYQQYPKFADDWLNVTGYRDFPLRSLFSWKDTSEGWEYWARLERAENNNDDLIKKMEAFKAQYNELGILMN